jgi:hypothetical protein
MEIGIVEAMTLEISRILETLFDGIEYRQAKNAAARMEKEKMKARRRSCESRFDASEFQSGSPQPELRWFKAPLEN